MRRPTILYVCFPYSVHAARWSSLLRGTKWDVHVFPSQHSNYLHASFDDITYWRAPNAEMVLNGQAMLRLGDLGSSRTEGDNTGDLSDHLAAVLSENQFDIIHSLEFQHAGYLVHSALKKVQGRRPIWIATNYGADIVLYGKHADHEPRVREILTGCDLYSAECARDVELARNLGFTGEVFTVLPNSGGVSLAEARTLNAGRTSERRVVAVKGYEHFAGRALTALKAVDLCRHFLRDYEVQVFGAFPEVRAEAARLASERGIRISCLPDHAPHQDILRLHGSARVSIAISIADGISTSLLEAMAMGSFPIQTCTACANEWIEDGQGGFIVDPENPYQIAHRLSVALTDDALVDNAATENWNVITQKADRALIQSEVQRAYDRVIRRHGTRAGGPHVASTMGPRRPSLTVITPTYNRASFLAETMDSVLAQNYPDLNYIVIDDGSTDNTGEVIEPYRSRVSYLRHENIGETRTVNRALQLVDTKYFMIVNSDDPLAPGCLETMVDKLEENPDALAAYPDWQIIGPKSEDLGSVQVGSFDIDKLLTSANVPIGPGACFRHTVLESVGYRNPLLRYSADLEYWYRVAIAGKMLHVPQVLATHRVHPDSASISDRGSLLASETCFLFQVYANHPRRADAGVRGRALANGHFAAAFVCSKRIEAAREFIRSMLSNPVMALERLAGQNAEYVANLLESLPGISKGECHDLFASAIAAPTRRKAHRSMVRGLLQNAPSMIRLAGQHGIDDLLVIVRRMPPG